MWQCTVSYGISKVRSWKTTIRARPELSWEKPIEKRLVRWIFEHASSEWSRTSSCARTRFNTARDITWTTPWPTARVKQSWRGVRSSHGGKKEKKKREEPSETFSRNVGVHLPPPLPPLTCVHIELLSRTLPYLNDLSVTPFLSFSFFSTAPRGTCSQCTQGTRRRYFRMRGFPTISGRTWIRSVGFP